MTDNLITFRVERNISIVQMAKLLNVSHDYYAKIEREKRNPSYNFLCKFKYAFPAANIDEIFFELSLDKMSKKYLISNI